MSCLPSISQLASLLTSTSTSTSTSSFTDNTVDILTLGSGWTGSFLIPIAQQANKSIQSTSRDGRDSTIQFNFDPDSDSSANFFKLPNAKTVVIIFPLYTTDSVLKLVRFYRETRQEGSVESAFILLGSTGIWDNGPTFQSQPPPYSLTSSEYLPEKKKPSSPPTSPWLDRHSPYNSSNPRAQAEDQLLSLSKPSNPISDSSIKVSILCLSGLWGHGRSPRRFVGLLANSKEKLKEMTSVHLVHGRDVARAILAIHDDWDKTQGQRWLLTNERVYDLWDLASRFGNAGEAGRDKPPQGPQPQWIQELMFESLSNIDPNQRIRALPRSVEQMGKGLDGSEFWRTFGIRPEVPWVD